MLEVPRARRYSLVLLLALVAATAHASNATSRLLFGSCSKVHLPQPLWPWIRKRHPKAWIWAGDAVYGDRFVRAFPLTFEALGPQYLRDAYAKQNAIPEYARLREEVPYFLGTWDDHDFGLNDGMISVSRGAAAPSRHRCDSCPSPDEVGGLFLILRPFGPFPVNTMLRAGATRPRARASTRSSSATRACRATARSSASSTSMPVRGRRRGPATRSRARSCCTEATWTSS